MLAVTALAVYPLGLPSNRVSLLNKVKAGVQSGLRPRTHLHVIGWIN